MPPFPHPAPGARPTASALVLALLATGAFLRAAAPAAAPPSPWREALRFEFNAASDDFARLYAASPGDARVALAHASTLLARQPRAQSNILEARAVLEKLVSTSAASSSSPASPSSAHADLVIAAKLLLGRIAESHLTPPRVDEARERYETLLREHAGHPLADQAVVHLALLDVFPEPGSAERAGPSGALQTRLDSLRESVRTPEVRRELHALQGRLHLDADDPRAALPHLVAARAIGYRQPDRDADADLTIANLARDAGDAALALTHYRAFLQARPRDPRATTARRLATELETAAASSPVSAVPPRS